jgi:hypothetical protein
MEHHYGFYLREAQEDEVFKDFGFAFLFSILQDFSYL